MEACKVSLYFLPEADWLVSLMHMYLFTSASQYLILILDGRVANYIINSFHVYFRLVPLRRSCLLWKTIYYPFPLLLSDDAKERLEFESFKKFLEQQTNKPEGNSWWLTADLFSVRTSGLLVSMQYRSSVVNIQLWAINKCTPIMSLIHTLSGIWTWLGMLWLSQSGIEVSLEECRFRGWITHVIR